MNQSYLPGDTVGVEGGFLASLAYYIFEPQTHLFHFLTVRSRLEEEDDYEIIEMLNRGCEIGRLSWYAGRYYVVFRPADPAAMPLGKKAAKYASKFGRRSYDYSLFLRLPADLLSCWFWQLVKEHRLRRIRPSELKLAANAAFVCTELPVNIWNEVCLRLLMANDAALPCGYVDAEQHSRLVVVDVHYPEVSHG